MSEKSECAVSQSSQELEDLSSGNLGQKQSIGGDEQLLSDTSVVRGELKSENSESTTLERDSESVKSGHEKRMVEELKPGMTESILLERESSIDKKQMNIGEEITQSDTAVLADGFTSESSTTILKCENKNVSKLLHSGDELTQSDAAVGEGGSQFENTDSTLVDSVSTLDGKQLYNEEELILSDKADLENRSESLCTDSTPLNCDRIKDGKQQHNEEELRMSGVLEEGSISENIDSTLVEIDRKNDINVTYNDNNQSVHAAHDVLDDFSPLASNTDESALSDEHAQVSLEVKEKNNEIYDDQTVHVDGCDLHRKHDDQFAEEVKPDNINTVLLNTPDEEIAIDNFVVITSTELEQLSMEEKTPTNEVMLSYSTNLDQNNKSDGLKITLTQSCLKEEENTQQGIETNETLKELDLNTKVSVDENNANLGNCDTIIQSNESSQSICEVKNTIHDEDTNIEVTVETESVDDKDKGNVEQEGTVKLVDTFDGDAEKQKEINNVEEDLYHSSNAENDDPSNELGKEDNGNSKSSPSKFVEDPSADETTHKISLFVDNILNSVSTDQLNNSNEIMNPPDVTRLVESDNCTTSAINTLTENNDTVNSLDEDDLKQKTKISNQDIESDIDMSSTGNTIDENTNCTTEVQDSIDIASINLVQESCQFLITDEKIPDFESDSSKIQKQADENTTVPSSENEAEAEELESSSDIVDSFLPDTTKQCESEAVDPCEDDVSQSVLVQEQNVCKTEEKLNEEEYADSNYTSLNSIDIEDLVSEENGNNETLETSKIQEVETQELSNQVNTSLESRSNDANSQVPESDVAQTFSNAQNTTANMKSENKSKGNAVATVIKLGGIAVAGIGAALAAPILISTLGFEAGGIVAGSIAELLMETANSIGFGTMALSALESVGVEGLDIGTQVLIGVAGASTAGGVVAVAEVMRRNFNAEEKILDPNNGGENGEFDYNTSTSFNSRMDDLDSMCAYESSENLENASFEETNTPDNFRDEANDTEKQNFENDIEHSNQPIAIGNALTDGSTTATISPDSAIELNATEELDHDIIADVIENLKTTVEETQRHDNGKMEEESKGVFVHKQDDEKREDIKNKIEEEAQQDITNKDEEEVEQNLINKDEEEVQQNLINKDEEVTQQVLTNKDEKGTHQDLTNKDEEGTQQVLTNKDEKGTHQDLTNKDKEGIQQDCTYKSEEGIQQDYKNKNKDETQQDYTHKDENEIQLDYTHKDENETQLDYTHKDEEETQENIVDKQEDTLQKETQLDCKDKLREETNEITEQEK